MQKTIGIVLSIAALLIGFRFGVIGALVGAVVAGFCLKYFEIVAPNSAWVSETKGVAIAKYVLLFAVLVGLAVFAYFALNQ